MVATDFFERLRATVEALQPDGEDASWKEAHYEKVAELVREYTCHHCAHFVIGEEDSPTPERKLSDLATDALEDSAVEIVLSPSPRDESHKVLEELRSGKLKHRMLEEKYEAHEAVHYRRQYIEKMSRAFLTDLPYQGFDFARIQNQNCENPIGFVPIPVGIVGPLLLKTETNEEGKDIFIPMATTEGALIASTNRGCAALKGIGVNTTVDDVGMTRAPVFAFETNKAAQACRRWIELPETFELLKREFESTSNYAKLKKIEPNVHNRKLFLRFVATTGDAMGMNMVTKATKKAVDAIHQHLTKENVKVHVVSLSGNMCVDKKASAINWISGRGKSATAEAVIPSSVVKGVLRTTVDKMVELGQVKLGMGSANAVSIGGSNAHAANVVAAIFAATGQDLAQVVSSSMCATQLERTESGDLSISCTMNCIEVGTVGGGTNLAAQQAGLRLLGCCGAHPTQPGENAKKLAQVICATVLAGELSLLAAQCTDDL
ncbi:Hydroxymethylglutaryl-coenzyme A reductase family protein, partial [Aphelenchoides avenae]